MKFSKEGATMTFVEWYEATHDDQWHEDYAGLGGFIQEKEDEYSTYCHEHDIEPVWNG